MSGVQPVESRDSHLCLRRVLERPASISRLAVSPFGSGLIRRRRAAIWLNRSSVRSLVLAGSSFFLERMAVA